MEDILRKVIRKKLYESLETRNSKIISENLDKTQIKVAQEEYINNRLSKFNNEIKKIALENIYPNISDCLDEAIIQLRKSIENGERYAYNWNELLLH